MKIIRLLFFLFILNSCNKYLGTIDPDYIPKNEVDEVLSSNIEILESDDYINFGSVIYPKSKVLEKELNLNKFKKIASLDKNSKVYSNINNIYYSKKNLLTKISKSNLEKRIDYKINFDKGEYIIKIVENSKNIFFITNKSKLFRLNDNIFKLEIDLETYINSKPILLDNSILIFSVFGNVFEYDFKNNIAVKKGYFIPNHGTSLKSNSYLYKDLRSYLFNTGTLIFLNKFNNQYQPNYYVDDLNILSTMDLFEEFIDAPFEFENYLYFIEKNGFLSTFNPLTSEILWEININSAIEDFIFSDKGYLALLTKNKILLLDKKGKIVIDILHGVNSPISFLISLNEIYIFHKKGVSVFDINKKEPIKSIKLNFYNDIDILNFKSDLFIKDSKSLYKLSE